MKPIPLIFSNYGLCAAPLGAANKYVDGGCTNDGDGICNGGSGNPNCNCASGAGAAGPWKLMATALSNASCGDTVNVRGSHSTHGSNHAAGTFDGNYRTDKW